MEILIAGSMVYLALSLATVLCAWAMVATAARYDERMEDELAPGGPPAVRA